MREGSPYRLTARRRTVLVALMLLPALGVRALVPFGFMPEIDGAGIHIGFCPGEEQPPGALAGARAAEHLAHHHHHGGADHGSPVPASHPPCLFALSASPAFVPAAPALAPLPPVATALAAGPSSRVLPEGVVRAQSARGPPYPA
jgi:hypothetical protein